MHARLIVHCVHTQEGVGIVGVTVRCDRCNGHLLIGRDGNFILDEGCIDTPTHAIPERVYDPSVIHMRDGADADGGDLHDGGTDESEPMNPRFLRRVNL